MFRSLYQVLSGAGHAATPAIRETWVAAAMSVHMTGLAEKIASTFKNNITPEYNQQPQLAYAFDMGGAAVLADDDEDEEGELGAADEEWNGIVWAAVPKRRTSHRRKRLRMQNKWLKPIKNIETCSICGSPKLMHHLCPACLKETEKDTKAFKQATLAGVEEVDETQMEAKE